MSAESSFVTFTAHGYKWVVARGFETIVKSDPRALTAAPGTTLVKSGPARRVWRFTPGARAEAFEVYVKEYLLPDLRDRVKYVFRPAKAWREFRALLKLKELGIGAPEALAVGVRRRGASLEGSILITRAIPDVVPLDALVLDDCSRVRHGRVVAFTAALAEFLSRLHGAGFLQRDFHAANVLVRTRGDAIDFFLVDLHDVAFRAPLGLAARVENLAVLGRFFSRVVPRHWRLRFLNRYLAGLGGADAAYVSRQIERLAERGLRRLWAKRDRRVFGDNKYFRRVKAGRLAGHARRTEQADAALGLFADGDPLPRADAILKNSRRSAVALFSVDAEGGRKRFLVKRTNPRGGLKGALAALRRSRAKKGFFFGAAFETRALPTPEVLAVLEARKPFSAGPSYLVTEYVEGAENLAEVLAKGKASPVFQKLSAGRAEFIERLARLVRRMHWCGFSMRDLKAANVLLSIVPDAADSPGLAVNFIDLDALRLYRGAVPEPRAIQNVARLYFDAAYLGAVTRREAISFLKVYLGRADRERMNRWISAVAAYVRKGRATFNLTGVFAQRSKPPVP